MRPVMLMILDGYGIAPPSEGNAVSLAKTPVMDTLKANYPNTTLDASGLAVGLPEGQMGNSEVGHLNLGAGRVVYQELTRLTRAVETGELFANEALNQAVDYAEKTGGAVHLMGLVSKGGVHSHMAHLFGLLELLKRRQFHRVYVHAFLDGRDVSPHAGRADIEELIAYMEKIGVGKLATIDGRYYAMDRDNRWERVKLAYDAIVYGEGQMTDDPIAAIEKSYGEEITDEFFIPTVITENGIPRAKLTSDDSVIFFNFRPDRARQLTRAIVEDDFNGFEREHRIHPFYVTMTTYDATFRNVHIAFGPQTILDTLGEVVSRAGKKQLRIAETEKYAHVTFFFNGGVEKPNDNEDRILIPSPKVATYDLQPEMSAVQVKDAVIEAIESDQYDLIILNFANSDMVGHTGVIPAAVKAVETVDTCVGEIVDAIVRADGSVFITADHGNSEKMLDENGGPFTAHTTNPVPAILVSDWENIELRHGKLADVAPTLLELMDIQKPALMAGESIIINKEEI